MSRIALTLTQSRNRELLTQLLADYEIVSVSDAVPDETALCLVDEQGLEQAFEALVNWKESQQIFQPVLLLTESTEEAWNQYAHLLEGTLDAIQTIPAPKRAIRSRVESLVARHNDSKELVRERKLNERIFETSPIAKTVLDTEGTIVRANKRAEDVLGLTVSEISGRSYDAPEWRSFDTDGDPIPSDELPFARVMETGTPVYDYVHGIERSTGEHVWLSVNMAPLYDEAGKIEFLVAAIEDITDRKERQLELERMTHAVDEAPIGISLSDPSQEDNPLIYVNEGFVELTGYSREEAIGRNCRFLQGESTSEETVTTMRQAIKAADPVSVEIRNYRADGTEFWNHLRIAPVRDTDGTVQSYIGFQQDVTDRVDRQQELTKIDRYLRHNIRNNVTLVNGMAELIQQEGDPTVIRYAEAIERAGKRLMQNAENQRQITEILQSEPVIKSIDIIQMLGNVIDEVQDQYPAVEIPMSGPESVLVQGTGWLDVALTELLENALGHNDGKSPSARVDVSAANGRVTVVIADNGPGIPEMEVEILTGRAEETPTYHSQGLGLWLVQLIVRRSGGKITIKTDDVQGTEVSIILNQESCE